MKRIFTFMAALLVSVASFAQFGNQELTKWTVKYEADNEADVYNVIFTGKIAEGYHTYTLTDELSATGFMELELKDCQLVGEAYELGQPKEVIDEFGDKAVHYYDEIIIAQKVKATGQSPVFSGTLFNMTCDLGTCTPIYYDFEVSLPSTATTVAEATAKSATEDSNIWALILEAILWGFAMLLTPCVFPMVPMTVTFFMKGSENVAQGRFKATMYGLFIVLLYTVPISVIILLTQVIGGDAVTADIFNWLSTHWVPNVIFFVVFMIFAASFFGAFEITLPQSLVNKSDKGSDKKGLAGVFFMALTLVLVSFSCTGPIVGTVLIKATQGGQFWEPMVTMLAFSLAFALPFTILAFSPSLLKKFKKSGGGWLNSVKVVLGFIELALGLKFLSTADQTYHWGLLDREVYLAIWIAIFILLGLYLLGKIRFAHDEPVEHLSVTRLSLAVAVFSFVIYLFPGMWGAPLKSLSGYLPPITTQDFAVQYIQQTQNKYDLHLPLGLNGHFTLKEGLEAAKKENKPIFVDVTGHGCVNCREMESRVWSDSRVLKMLQENFVIVALYVDDKQDLHQEDWITDAKTGKVYKQMGRANSYLARSLWEVNAQPNYVLLSPDGEKLVPSRGYDLDIEEFINFLQSGLNAYAAKK